MSASAPQHRTRSLPQERDGDRACEAVWAAPEEAVMRRLTRERLLARERLAPSPAPQSTWPKRRLPAAE